MSIGYDDGADGQYLISTEMNASMYESGTSSESSASSPLNVRIDNPSAHCSSANIVHQGYENMYPGSQFIPYPAYPPQYPTNGEYAAPMGLIPVELDIEGLYEDHDRRRKNGTEKVVASHVHSVRLTSLPSPTTSVPKQKLTMDFHSVVEPRTEPPNAPSETGRRNT